MSTVAATTPYPWPYDGLFDLERVALLVVGSAQVSGSGPVVAAVATALRDAGGVVVEVTTALPRRGSAPTVPPVGDLPVDHRVDAAGIDGFFGSPLDSLLRSLRRDQLLLAGAWLEIGVHSTLRSANDRGYECLLVLDACTAFDPSLTDAARSQIEMSGGIFGAVGQSADVLAAILRRERNSS